MVWTLFRQQQQRGAQIQPRPGSRRERRRQPSSQHQAQQGETELDQDEHGEDAEQTVDPQAEQALREVERDSDEPDEPGRFDRND